MADSDRLVLRTLLDAANLGEARAKHEDPDERQRSVERLAKRMDWSLNTARKLYDAAQRVQPSRFDYINTPPGSGKSRDATEFANTLWEEAGKKSLYLMLTNKAICERISRLKEDGKWDGWTRWEPHKPTCDVTRSAAQGYSAHCTCGRVDKEVTGPTIATLDNIIPTLPDSSLPLVESANAFDVWLIDEIDFQRFVGCKEIGYGDIKAASFEHPDKAVSLMSKALGSVMDSLAPDQTISGQEFYDALFERLDQLSADYMMDWESFKSATLERRPWSSQKPRPINSPLFLRPVMVDEFKTVAGGQPFNPRIYVSGRKGKSEPQLRVWWRRDLLDAYEIADKDGKMHDYHLPETWVLDATADTELLGRCLSDDYLGWGDDGPLPKWPLNVHVSQWKNDTVSMTTLGIGPKKSCKATKRWYGRLLTELAAFTDEYAGHKVGVITHKKIESEVVEQIRGAGFRNVVSLHYGQERGSNYMEDARILVLFGLPIPPVDGFKEEASAFFYDEAPLDFDFGERTMSLNMTDDSTTEVKVKGYWKEPVARYYQQKCQSGLYQALHRIRPYNDQPYDRHILIFTNMPIDGVEVDRLMIGEREATTSNRLDRAADFMLEQLGPSGEVTKKALVRHLEPSDKAKTLSIDRWVERESAALGAATDTVFMPWVVGGEPARFVRADDGGGSE